MQLRNFLPDECAVDLSFLESSFEDEDGNGSVETVSLPDILPDLVESSSSSSGNTPPSPSGNAPPPFPPGNTTTTPPQPNTTALQRMMHVVNSILMEIRNYHGIETLSEEPPEPKDMNDALCIYNNLEQEMQEKRTTEERFQDEEAENEMNFWLQRIGC